MMIEPVILIYLALWGYLFASAASFGDALAERILNAHYRKSRKTISDKIKYIWGGRSVCDHCQTVISPLHVLPVLGYLLAKGRCQTCHEKLSRRYLYQESLAFFYGFFLATLFGEWIYLAFSAAYLVLSILIAKVDHEFFLIPLEATFAILLLGFGELFFTATSAKMIYLGLGVAVIWFFLLLLLYFVYQNKLGLGDLYLVFAMSIALAFPRSVYLPTLASLMGLTWYALHRKNTESFLKTKVPFGVYLALAFLVLRMFPSEILF